MKKKGQIYILAALILIVIIYGMVTVVNKTSQESIESDFEKLSTNYASEGAKLINGIMESYDEKTSEYTLQEAVIDTFKEYTRSFTAYSKTQSTNFGLIYAFYYTGEGTGEGRVYIGNYLNMPILVSYTTNSRDSIFIEGCYAKIDASAGFDGIALKIQPLARALKECEKELPPLDQPETQVVTLYVTIGGYGYTFDIKPDQLEIIIVSREDHPEQRKIFVEGTFATDVGAEDTTSFSEYCESGAGTEVCQEVGTGEQQITTVNCGAVYATRDDCIQDDACRWDSPETTCKNREEYSR